MHPSHSLKIKFKGAFGFDVFALFSAIFAFSDSSFFRIGEVKHESDASSKLLSNTVRPTSIGREYHRFRMHSFLNSRAARQVSVSRAISRF